MRTHQSASLVRRAARLSQVFASLARSKSATKAAAYTGGEDVEAEGDKRLTLPRMTDSVGKMCQDNWSGRNKTGKGG